MGKENSEEEQAVEEEEAYVVVVVAENCAVDSGMNGVVTLV